MSVEQREEARADWQSADKFLAPISRRHFFRTSVLGAMAGAATGAGLDRLAYAAEATPSRLLIKGGTVLSVDPAVGDFDAADVLIEGSRIVAVGKNMSPQGARIFPAENMIVMPGFIDTHRHMWQGQLRNCSPHGTEYLTFRNKCGPLYRPEDAYVGDTLSALSALDAGVTTILDWSHIQNSPEHTDAVIRALQNSGIRSVFGYGWPMPGTIPWWENKTTKFPWDIRRLRKQYFSSDDQLLTLAMCPTSRNSATSWYEQFPDKMKQEWAAGREVGAHISVHTSEPGSPAAFAKLFSLASDTTYVHCTHYTATDFKMIADTGGTVSFCCSLDTLQGRGIPEFREAMSQGIRPSLSVDEEMDAPNDLFTQMRLALSLQRSSGKAREGRGQKEMLSAQDVMEFATLQGARANALEMKIGSLTPGKEADIILLRKDRLNVLPVNSPVGAVVLAMDTGNVDSVFVAGKARKLHGQMVGVDMKKVAEEAYKSQHYLLSKAGIKE